MNKQELQKQANGLPSTLLDKRVLVDKSVILRLIEQLEEPDIFVRDWLDRYEVERKKLYTVEIPNPNNPTTLVLSRGRDRKVIVEPAMLFDGQWRKREVYQLTEAEIKQDFEWAWQWAEEVE